MRAAPTALVACLLLRAVSGCAADETRVVFVAEDFPEACVGRGVDAYVVEVFDASEGTTCIEAMREERVIARRCACPGEHVLEDAATLDASLLGTRLHDVGDGAVCVRVVGLALLDGEACEQCATEWTLPGVFVDRLASCSLSLGGPGAATGSPMGLATQCPPPDGVDPASLDHFDGCQLLRCARGRAACEAPMMCCE